MCKGDNYWKKDLRHIIKWEMWTLLDSWFEQDTICNKATKRQLGKFKMKLQLILEQHGLVVPFPSPIETHK